MIIPLVDRSLEREDAAINYTVSPCHQGQAEPTPTLSIYSCQMMAIVPIPKFWPKRRRNK